MQKKTKIGVEESLTEASLGSKCLGLCNKDREIYTLKINMYVIFYANPIKGGRNCAFNKCFNSKQFGEIFLTIKNI